MKLIKVQTVAGTALGEFKTTWDVGTGYCEILDGPVLHTDPGMNNSILSDIEESLTGMEFGGSRHVSCHGGHRFIVVVPFD